MVKMIKDGKEYDIAEARVAKLLKRGFKLVEETKLVEGTPDTKVVDDDQDDHNNQGDI